MIKPEIEANKSAAKILIARDKGINNIKNINTLSIKLVSFL